MNRDLEGDIPPEVLEALRRNSGIGLTRDGRFTLYDRPVQNPRVEALFHRGLAVRGDDVVLTVGARWCYVACEGVACFVQAIRFTESAIVARLADDAVREARDPVIGYGPDDRLYLWLGVDAPPAILLRAAHQELLGLVDDALRVPTPWGDTLAVRRLDAVPTPSTPPPVARGGSES